MCLGSLFMASIVRSLACGAELDVPSNHFDGVNEYGDLSYWQKIGELDLGEGLVFPLLINFNSSRESSSPIAGKGWIVAPLDVTMTQLEENLFHMHQPNGTNTYFRRNNTNETVLRGMGTWLAEIKGDTISAYASCGWRINFTRGRLTSIQTPKSRTINFEYAGGQLVAIKEGTKTWLTAEADPEKKAMVLSCQGKKIALAQDKKPLVQSINGQNLVGGMESALSEVTKEDGTKSFFEYGVDEKLNPTLKIKEGESERLMTWGINKKIIQDGDWVYNIVKESGGIGMYAAVGRNNPKGEKEFWFFDRNLGRETIEGNGIRTVKTWFVSGSLAGKLRRIEEVQRDKTRVLYSAVYDEKGRLLRSLDQTGTTTSYVYGKSGEIVSIFEERGGTRKLRQHYEYDGNLKLISLCDRFGRIFEFANSPDGTSMLVGEKKADPSFLLSLLEGSK